MSRTAQSFMVGILIIAGLFVLVRPNSKGSLLVQVVGDGLHNLIAASTGGQPVKYPKGV